MTDTTSQPVATGHSPSAQPVGLGQVLAQPRTSDTLTAPDVVRFNNVAKTYNSGRSNAYTAITNVSFVVEDLPDKGEFVCILGPSGCGKSTILRLIAGLEPQHPATAGEVLVFGSPITGAGSDRGMVFQDYTSFDHRTVLENVTFGLECRGVPRRRRDALGRQWIERVGLSIRADTDKYPHELSGGMRQRVAIARTSSSPAHHPHGRAIRGPGPRTPDEHAGSAGQASGAREATVFFVTHSIEEAVYLGDRVYIMSNSPGTILRELEVEPADRPSKEMQREARFQETVYYIRDLITQLEEGRV
jgi:NitT/TauT family transport system ATP-binding protein